jgi:hypothetical protein
MALKRITIRVSDTVKREVLNHSIHCVTQLYFRLLGKIDLPGCNYINIFLTEDRSEESKVKKFANFWEYYILFDFDKYNDIPNKYDKKLMTLNALHQALLRQTALYGWTEERFAKAYEECISRRLINEWFFKDKLFLSPNRKYYIGLYNVHDLGKHEVYEVLYDKNKTELTRRRCFHDDGLVFTIGWASWEKQSDVFYYTFRGPQKRFECVISELLKGKEYDLPEIMNTSLFFKK